MSKRIAVVVGGASGLGKAAAVALHSEGFSVTVADRDGGGAKSVADTVGGRGVRVNAIAPGLVMTPLTEGMKFVPGVTEDYVVNTPLGRAGTPEKIAAAVVYLTPEKAAWITGEVLDINGGAHMLRYPNLGKHFAGLK